MAVRGPRRRPHRPKLEAPPPRALRPEAIRAEIERRAWRGVGPIGGGLLVAAGLAAAPLLGPASLVASAVGAVAGVASWWNNSRGRRGRELMAARQLELQAAVIAAKVDGLEQLADDFTYYSLPLGATQARELGEAWRLLLQTTSGRDEVISMEFGHLGDEAFGEGVRLLEAARDARAGLETIDTRSLNRELDSWRREREGLDEANPDALARAPALDQRIAAHERRLALVAEQTIAIGRLFAEVEKLEGALHEAYLSLVGQGTAEALGRDSGADGLAGAVEVARRVAARVEALDQLGSRSPPDGE